MEETNPERLKPEYMAMNLKLLQDSTYECYLNLSKKNELIPDEGLSGLKMTQDEAHQILYEGLWQEVYHINSSLMNVKNSNIAKGQLAMKFHNQLQKMSVEDRNKYLDSGAAKNIIQSMKKMEQYIEATKPAFLKEGQLQAENANEISTVKLITAMRENQVEAFLKSGMEVPVKQENAIQKDVQNPEYTMA